MEMVLTYILKTYGGQAEQDNRTYHKYKKIPVQKRVFFYTYDL